MKNWQLRSLRKDQLVTLIDKKRVPELITSFKKDTLLDIAECQRKEGKSHDRA